MFGFSAVKIPRSSLNPVLGSTYLEKVGEVSTIITNVDIPVTTASELAAGTNACSLRRVPLKLTCSALVSHNFVGLGLYFERSP